MTTRPATVLSACLFFLLGEMLYKFAVHHTLPTLADIPAYLEIAVVFIVTWLVIEFFRSRRNRP